MKLANSPSSCKVYTPQDLATAMVNTLGDGPDFLWLEPSHGRGVFVESLARLGVPKNRIVAVDLDLAQAPADKLATTYRGIDFLRWSQETQDRFHRVVGNPPFVSIGSLAPSLKRSAEPTKDVNGKPIGRGANLWYAFVLASLRLLRNGGSMAFVLPSAAEFADYANAMRSTVLERFGALELYRCRTSLFEDVQEGTVVAVARNFGSQPCLVRRRLFNSKAGLIEGLSRSGSIYGRACRPIRRYSGSGMVELKAVASINLGGVTGDARFFLMTEAERKSNRLPTAAFTRVVSKAKHLRSASIDRELWNSLKEGGHRVWLFRPTKALANHPKVRRYLRLAHEDGGCNRKAYKVSIRNPWFRTPLPETPDAFLSGMSESGPWFCINNMPHLNASNTLYVVRFRDRDPEAWYQWSVALLTTIVQRQMRRMGRRYADGLIKFEPGALGNIRLPRLRTDVDLKPLYHRAVAALLNGDSRTARAIANSVLA